MTSRGSVLATAAVLAAVAMLCAPFALHLAQKRHNVVPFRVETAYPKGKAIVSGEVFATMLAEVIEHELSGATGWRPNDLFLWGPGLWADNNANRQRGIIQAVRKTVTVLKDHLTKFSSDEYDTNLVAAETALYNDAERLLLPSAEKKLGDGAAALRRYVDGLKSTPVRSRPINQRNVEMIRLFQAWTDLLGDAHGNLFKEEEDGHAVRWWKTDDYFYHAQGFAHVMYYLMAALEREYEVDLTNRPSLHTLFHEVTAALGRAATLKPLVVLDGSPAALRANHRRNLDAFVSEARQKMYSIREELEK